MEPIATQLLGSATATVTFSNIPNTYKHLQIRGIGQCNRTAAGTGAFGMIFNGDSSASYSDHMVYGYQTGVGAQAHTSATYAYCGFVVGQSYGSSVMSGFVIDILDYANVNKNKTIRCLFGTDSSQVEVGLGSGAWYNTAAITSITLSAPAQSFNANTRFSLYGIKG
jgi:hypothetical protein